MDPDNFTEQKTSIDNEAIVVGGPGVGPRSTSSRRFSMLFGLAALVVVVVGVSLVIHNHKSPTTAVAALAPAQVQITNSGFSPSTVTVALDQGVVWTNSDSNSHEVAVDPFPTDNSLAGFDENSPMSANGSYAFVFDKPGTYTYHDNLNPYKYHGTVIVR